MLRAHRDRLAEQLQHWIDAVDPPTDSAPRASWEGRGKPVYQGDATAIMGQMLDRINSGSMKEVYEQLGMAAPEPVTAATWETVEASTLTGMSGGGVLAAQPPLGVPGTNITDGRINVEQNSRLGNVQARGSVSKPGTNEDAYRSEPVIFESVNQLATLVCSATYEPHIPEGLPADVVAEVERQHRAIRYIMLRDDFLTNASSFIKHGFSYFEILWETKEPTVAGLEFREQSTVYRWLFDDRQAQWLGTEFKVGGQASGKGYIIPNGRTLRTARSLLVNIHAQGNNLEGCSPVRVATGMRMLKKAILEMTGIGLQKFLVPLALIVHEAIDAASTYVSSLGTSDHVAEVQTLIGRLENLKGRIGGVLPVPMGRKVEFANPSNDMPDVIPLLTYLDTMMGLVFSNEGALLGNQSFGSYAMASTSLERFRASAPAYAGRVASALTKLLHIGLELNGYRLEDLDAVPTYSYRFNGTQDASKWIDDVVKVMNSEPAAWTDEVRKTTTAKLGLPSDAFDGVEIETGETNDQPDNDQASGDDIAKTALNGAQVTSMVEVLTQVATGQLPAESAIRILMRAFQMSREDASAMVNPADDFEPAGEPESDGIEFDEPAPTPFGDEEE